MAFSSFAGRLSAQASTGRQRATDSMILLILIIIMKKNKRAQESKLSSPHDLVSVKLCVYSSMGSCSMVTYWVLKVPAAQVASQTPEIILPPEGVNWKMTASS